MKKNTKYLVFNGDADGLCAAHQLLLNQPFDYHPITGVKRDIALLKKIKDISNAEIIVLDVAVEKNLPLIEPLLIKNCHIQWFDHHVSPDKPNHQNIEYHVHTNSSINTSWIVADYLGGDKSLWAVVGLFGDNMVDTATSLAEKLGLNREQTIELKKAGELLNYNAYGSSLDDLFFPPAEVLKKMEPYSDPFDFIKQETVIEILDKGRNEDFIKAKDAEWLSSNIMVLPDKKWARRAIGSYANYLMQQLPERHLAVLLTLGDTYQVSIRTAKNGNKNAAEFCLQFPTGGGRASAAGINQLPFSELEEFKNKFNQFLEIS